MVSLKDIADKSGYSIATISKALRNMPDISKKPKDKIQNIAREMGYFPNAAARALKTNQSRNIGVLYHEETGLGLKHEYFSGVLQGFMLEARQLGYDITFLGNCDADMNMTYLEHCKYRNFDGVVIVCAKFEDEEVVNLMESELPVVTIDYEFPSCISVSSNNSKGIHELVNYAIQKGHTKIAYIHGEPHSFVTNERVNAFKDALRKNHIEINDDYIIEGKYGNADITEQHTNKLLDLEVPPTCIFYPDDLSAIGGINAIIKRGLKISEDVSVVGYDGVTFSQFLSPKLTTIRQDTDRIGAEAAKRLINIIENGSDSIVERVIVDGELLEGESLK